MKKYILMILLAGWILLILFLSFQNGQDTANTSFTFTKYIFDLFRKGESDYSSLMLWDGRFRLAAHFVLFLLYGIMGESVISEFAQKRITAIWVTVGSGLFLAVVSEVGKIMISGRHCDLSEMCLNITGMVAGVALIVILQCLKQRLDKKKEL